MNRPPPDPPDAPRAHRNGAAPARGFDPYRYAELFRLQARAYAA